MPLEDADPASRRYWAAPAPSTSGTHHAAQGLVERAEVGLEVLALVTVGQVGLDLGRVPLAEPLADEGAQVLDAEPAGVRRPGLEVDLEVGLAQAFPGPHGERGGGVGGETEEGGDRGGRLALDLGVPEHQLPPLGQLLERLEDQALVGAVLRVHREPEIEPVGFVLLRAETVARPRPPTAARPCGARR